MRFFFYGAEFERAWEERVRKVAAQLASRQEQHAVESHAAEGSREGQDCEDAKKREDALEESQEEHCNRESEQSYELVSSVEKSALEEEEQQQKSLKLLLEMDAEKREGKGVERVKQQAPTYHD